MVRQMPPTSKLIKFFQFSGRFCIFVEYIQLQHWKDIILITNSMAYGEEAAEAADIWMRTPHPEWSGIDVKRINADGRREWLNRSTTVQRCRERLHPPGYKAPALTHRLGE